MLDKQDLCPSCGTYDEEWRDPKTKRFLDPAPYQVVRHTCAGCQVLEDEREQAEKDPDTDTVGMHLRMVRTDPLEYMNDEG